MSHLLTHSLQNPKKTKNKTNKQFTPRALLIWFPQSGKSSTKSSTTKHGSLVSKRQAFWSPPGWAWSFWTGIGIGVCPMKTHPITSKSNADRDSRVATPAAICHPGQALMRALKVLNLQKDVDQIHFSRDALAKWMASQQHVFSLAWQALPLMPCDWTKALINSHACQACLDGGLASSGSKLSSKRTGSPF